ncbi:hypothetical protein ACIGB8_11265 [Promicromonospora sukumoe]|uniref:hypothetical protein n=1 Tax=Promicromonospora sukumoe TaxID=88382 RepID=UPI0037C9486D
MTGSRNFERTPGLAQLARRQHAVVTRGQLAGLGISARHVSHQIAALRWRAVTSDVVVLHNGPLPRDAKLWVAVLDVEPPVALGSWTGLRRHGLRGWDRDGVHIVVPRGAKTRRLPGVVVHESRRPAPEDIVRLARLPVHTVQRCAIDAAAWQDSPRTAVGLLAAVVQQRMASPEQLWDQLERVGKVRFRDLMRRSVADIRGGSDALSEIDLVRLCRRHGLPEPKQQERRVDSRGRTRFLDAVWILDDGRRLLVEIDGIGHMEVARWYDDVLRDAELTTGDREIRLRLPAAAARTEPDRVVAILKRHLGPR